MPNYTRSVRGDVNVILNGMIRDGVITSFETNFSDPVSIAFGLHIRVLAHIGAAPRTRAFDERRRELRDRILGQLKPIAPDVIVSVRAGRNPWRHHGRAVSSRPPPTWLVSRGFRSRSRRRIPSDWRL